MSRASGRVQRDADALEDVEVEVRLAAFDPALDHPADACASRQFRPCPAAALAHRPDFAADTDPLLTVPVGRLDG